MSDQIVADASEVGAVVLRALASLADSPAALADAFDEATRRMTFAEADEALGVRRGTILGAVERGEIQPYQFPGSTRKWVTRALVAKWLEEYCHPKTRPPLPGSWRPPDAPMPQAEGEGTRLYRDRDGSAASIEMTGGEYPWHLHICHADARQPDIERAYKTFQGARVALTRMGAGWAEVTE